MGKKKKLSSVLHPDDPEVASAFIVHNSSSTGIPNVEPVFIHSEPVADDHDHQSGHPMDVDMQQDLGDNIMDFGDEDHGIPKTKRQHDYLGEFMQRADSLLEALLNREAHDPSTTCFNSTCTRRARWRCRDCTMPVPLCRGCMRRTHLRNCLHRIECWTGKYFRHAELQEVGAYMVIGHQHQERICEHLVCSMEILERIGAHEDELEQEVIMTQWPNAGDSSVPDADNDAAQEDPVTEEEFLSEAANIDRILEEDEDFAGDEEEEVILDQGPAATDAYDGGLEAHDPPPQTKTLFKSVRIVHTNGIHTLPLVVCGCQHHDQIALDLMYNGLVVTSFKRHRTVFTIQVLDYFRLLNLELRGSAYQFYQLLRRLTLPMRPGDVVNLYHELRRLSRCWRWLKKRKWAGAASGADISKPGALAPFCPTCPQPDRNLPQNWKWSLIKWIYRRSVVIDGNFKADHVRQKHPMLDLWLSDGSGMMPNAAEYVSFLEKASEYPTKAPCEAHFRAIEKALLSSKACDITGVVAVACARHGCYAPNSLCNLFKGEQQKNVDFALLKAIETTNIHPEQGLMIMYDIACQYIINLRKRIGDKLPEGLEIDRAIGMFHVHGHKDQCFFRYSPAFIPWIGKVAGEILETLWNPLNPISIASRTATLPHRAEILDDHSCDSNHKKTIHMVKFLCDKFVDAVQYARNSKAYFEGLTETAGPTWTRQWDAKIKSAESRRQKQPWAMDIYASAVKPTGNLPAAFELTEEPDNEPVSAVQEFLFLALAMEETQLDLQDRVRRLRREPREEDRVKIEQMRQQLHDNFQVLQSYQAALVPGELQLGSQAEDPSAADFDDLDDEIVLPQGQANEEDAADAALTIERRALPLPSQGAFPGNELLNAAERSLRQSRAAKHLGVLRDAIAHKSLQWLEAYRNASRKSMKTRAMTTIADINHEIGLHCRAYRQCRTALVALRAPEEVLLRFQPLQPEHIRASTAIKTPNVAGSSTLRLSWIWQIDQDGRVTEPAEGTKEYQRVHWLRARAESQRWEEEETLLTHEMHWTTRDFDFRSREWSKLAANEAQAAGPKAYAYRKAATWHSLAAAAEQVFSRVNIRYVHVFPH